MSNEAVSAKIKVAVIGSGNIGTDLMIKILRTSENLEIVALVGIDPDSDGLKRAAGFGVRVIANGITGLTQLPIWAEIDIVFDATSAAAHKLNSDICSDAGKVVIDLTPAAIGPYVIPVVNGDAHVGAKNLNMVTCGGQATIPIVAAVSRVAAVCYGEIISSIASRSAGPGTRANIDEFTQTTSRGIETVGGAAKGKAIIILNPAEPPMMMRGTVFTLSSGGTEEQIEASVNAMVEKVQAYVPGYRLKQKIQFERFGSNNPVVIPGIGIFEGLKTSVFLEVEGAAHYLPAYAGNLDIMTSAALATAEKIAATKRAERLAA
jgi:acetaldehyde dehydrogenase